MYINMKKIYRYGILMVIGLSLFFYGIIEGVIKDHSMKEPTDAQVIERARELGMVDLREQLLEDFEENE